MNHSTRFTLFLSLTVTSTVFAVDDSKFDQYEDALSNIQTHWDNLYVSEGRDNLDGGALHTTVIEAHLGFFQLTVENLWGYDSDYNELNLIPALVFKNKEFTFYASYTRRQLTEQGEFDNEIGSGISYSGLPGKLDVGFEWYHSFIADGGFFELSLTREFDLSDRLVLEPVLVMGINNNYITDGHNGLNHVALQLNSYYELTENFGVHGRVTYNHAINRDAIANPGDVLLKNFVWGGIGLEYFF